MDTTLADPLVGAVLEGRYRITGRVARGGMATVYRAVDERLDRTVAVKVMHPGLAADEQFLGRFVREARAAARLSHPNVVAVFDQGTHDGLAFLVMELVPGRTLRDVLGEHGRLTPAQAVAVLEPVLAALSAAHRAGLVHRDVKPENVLLADDGSVKVADFGLARAVEAATENATRGVLIGTVAYLAPEQVATGSADGRTDVYAAGIMLYEMLTGEVPYAGESAMSVAYRHVHEDVPAPSGRAPVPPALDDLTVRATRRAPGARPADAGAFLAELREVRRDLDLAVVPPPMASARSATQHRTAAVPAGDHRAASRAPGPNRRSPGRLPRQHRWFVVLLVLLLGAVAGTAGWWIGGGRYTRAPSLLTLSRQQAVDRARTVGLTVRFGDPVFSEYAPVGSVVSQDPKPSDRLLKGAAVTVALSKGKERYRVPDVVGKDRSAAESALRALHLHPLVRVRYDDRVAAGRVLSVDPRAGTSVRNGTTVTVVVSGGPPPVDVPNVVGRGADDAKSALSDAGLLVGITSTYSDTVPKDRVIAQDPAGGTLPRGSTVKLTVSKGPPQVQVPDVRNLPAKDARSALEAAGFKVRRINIPFGSGKVIQQSPAAGRQAAKGSTVTIYVF